MVIPPATIGINSASLARIRTEPLGKIGCDLNQAALCPLGLLAETRDQSPWLIDCLPLQSNNLGCAEPGKRSETRSRAATQHNYFMVAQDSLEGPRCPFALIAVTL
jgi:hypothetical protein